MLCLLGGEWRLKYERAIREIEFTKKRLQQEFDDKLEMEQQNKRQLERRVRQHRTHTLLTAGEEGKAASDTHTSDSWRGG